MTPMQCNIDQRGRRVRLLWAIVMFALAVAVGASAVVGWWGGIWPWVVAAVLAAFGVFALYEARKGWCAVRAMGIKTPV